MTATVNSISINAVSINGATGAFLTKIWNNLLRKTATKSHAKTVRPTVKKIITPVIAEPIEFAINIMQIGVTVDFDGERYSIAHDINNDVKIPRICDIKTDEILPRIKIFFKD